MLEDILKNTQANRYITPYEDGKAIFLEGDDTQDLFILVSGRLNVFKGNKKIAQITEKGALFGEMSFLLNAKRTATIKAEKDVKAIQIPKEDIPGFLQDFPEVAGEITRLLAKRLDETSRILYGLKEFCDQLPDAVIATDKEGKIITWNAAAEEVYGRSWQQMCNKSVEKIYEQPDTYRKLVKEIKKKRSIREKILSIRHPKTGDRFISTSSTLLLDDHDNFQGILSLGRDVTSITALEKKFRRTRSWLVPSLILLFILGMGTFLRHVYFPQKPRFSNIEQKQLENRLNKDYLLLKSMLIGPFEAGDRSKTNRLMKNFFTDHKADHLPYKGLVLLDKNKMVFDAYSQNIEAGISTMTDGNYAGIEFKGDENALQHTLTLYRVDKDHPMGKKCVEIAFNIDKNNHRIGWLIFQMDLNRLKTKYGIDATGFKPFNF
jgi:PAS domain S-box-containing protein